MKPLSNEQKHLIFDYNLGLTNEAASAKAEELIFSNEEAAEINFRLKSALSPLEAVEVESCPEELVEQTASRLKELSRASHNRLEELLANEQSQSVEVQNPFLRNLGKVLTAAAVILFFAGVFFSSTKFVRQKSFQQACQMQLSRIYQGLSNYTIEHNDKLPMVATSQGQPWWKVGYQGNENVSNTRHIWLLVKGGYVKPQEFICPGTSSCQTALDLTELRKHNDFPNRNYITYSIRLRCPKTNSNGMTGRKVLMADMNPLFETLPDDYSSELKLKLDKKLAHLNSINHNRRGQNVLFTDGSVKFIKTRHTDISNDDIFTLRNTEIYKGIEVPSCEADAFLAP